MGRPKREDAAAETRRKRVPLGVLHSKLTVPADLIPSDYVGRWINDAESRIMMAQQGGYEFVENNGNYKIGDGIEDGNSDLGNKISKIVGTTKDGSEMRAYLMKIKRDWYEEDQAAKQAKVDETDRQIKEGGFKADGLSREKSYGKVDYNPMKYKP